VAKNILDDAPPEVQKIFHNLWADMQRQRNEAEKSAAQADPVKHRLSKVMEGGNTGYCYHERTNGRGSRVRFCYSKHRNVAGYFLIWREIETARSVKRDQWDATTSKACAVRTVAELAEAFGAKQRARP